MEAKASAVENFEVNFNATSIVKASGPLPEPHILTLSNLDLLSGRFPVTYFYFYRSSPNIKALKNSLAKTLNFFYPFAGRIIQNQSTNEPEIICDNSGALVLEASANIPLKNLDFYNLDHSLPGKLVSVKSELDFPLQVQVTSYTCGSSSMTFTFDHALGDASAFAKFLLSWSEIAQHKLITCTPDHSRHLRSRFPPTYHPSLDETFVKCSLEEIVNIPTRCILLKRLYHIDASSIRRLHKLACVNNNGKKITKIEAFSAHVWKLMAAAIDEGHEKCKMGWLVDGRSRLGGRQNQNTMANYIGNVLSLAVGEASVEELKQGSLSEIANNVQVSIAKATNEDHFLDLIDWIESHRPGLMLSRIVLGKEGPSVVVSSGRRFPVAELDFGFGEPVLGTMSSTVEKIGVNYLNQRQSAKCDGSWTVSAILWPELVAALETDSIFQPMCPTHLQL
ncbi:hypothetical protein Pint_02560 [Pistacia integerrima]|uniref:Uncharacterized protein n=1 Tax=Pistacia integerrima TaxID=434235 RepID=A0ACC0ZJR3_9ROSI|nr:hypothetical protein Pint_02560 [Pistacia integerrima]